VIGDYHGLIHPHTLFRVDSLVETTRLNNVERHSLGFKLRRKRFEIEPFVLPPDMDDDKKPSGGCGSEADPLAF
jgi:elongator complex protein 4